MEQDIRWKQRFRNYKKSLAPLEMALDLKEPDIKQKAKGNARNGSDVDLTLKGNDIRFETISHVNYLLNEEILMPCRFDVVNYHSITSPELIDHIDGVGVTIYQKHEKQSE